MKKSPFEMKKPGFYRKQFDGSDRLFRACWRMLGEFTPIMDDQHVLELLDSIAAAKVNDPKSVFYLRG